MTQLEKPCRNYTVGADGHRSTPPTVNSHCRRRWLLALLTVIAIGSCSTPAEQSKAAPEDVQLAVAFFQDTDPFRSWQDAELLVLMTELCGDLDGTEAGLEQALQRLGSQGVTDGLGQSLLGRVPSAACPDKDALTTYLICERIWRGVEDNGQPLDVVYCGDRPK